MEHLITLHCYRIQYCVSFTPNMTEDNSSLFYASPQYDILMNRKGEKPWKPYPPKRSVSLGKADAIRAPTPTDNAKNTSSKAKDKDAVESTVEPAPAIVSVVPVDVSGRSFARLKDQPKIKPSEEMEDAPLNGGSIARRVSARYSARLDASNYDLYSVQEHGFAVRQSLNLRGKTASKDRWIARTSMNLDPYSFEDEHRKTSSRGGGGGGGLIPRLEKKNKPNTSFLLCSSRKSIQSNPREPSRPYQVTPGERLASQTTSQASVILPSKRQRLSSEKPTREPAGFPRPTDTAREPDKNKKPRPGSSDLSQGQTPPVSSRPVANRIPDEAYGDAARLRVSDHEPFFVSVAAPSRHSFWMTSSKTRRSLPVPVPRLSDTDLTVATSTLELKNPKGAAEEFTVMRLEDAGRVPCSVQVISETGCDAKVRRVPASGGKIQALPGRKIENSNVVNKERYQPQCLPSPLDLKERERVSMSSALPVRHSPTNFGSLTKQSFRSISEDRREAFDNVHHHELKHGGFEKVEETMMQRLSVTSDFASDYERTNFSFPHPDGASVRSSTISDWYSARDGHSSSICMDSLGSDPVSLDCASSKSSTTLFTRVKRAIVQSLGAVWTMLVPTPTRYHLSPAPDSLSDVDSGYSFGTNIDLGMLQRSPSEMSEIQKLAVLAEKIAADKDREREESAGGNGNGGLSSNRRRLARAFSSELETILARSASLSGTRSSSKFAGEQAFWLPGCHTSSFGSGGIGADEAWRTSFPSEAQYSTLPLSSKRNSRDFESNPHNPLQQTCNYFSTTRPFVSSLKVQRDCGEIAEKTISQAVGGGASTKPPNVADSIPRNVADSIPSESSKQFSTVSKVTSGGNLSFSDDISPYKAPHFEISCNAQKQRGEVESRPSTSGTTSDVKWPNKTVARSASHTGTSTGTGNFTSMQPCKENFTRPSVNLKQCENNQLTIKVPSSRIQAESLSTNFDRAVKSFAPISTSQKQRLASHLYPQKPIIASSAEPSREFTSSGRGTYPDEQLSSAQFSVSPELDQAIEMLTACSRRIELDCSPEHSSISSCITTSTSKEASSSKEKNLNDTYVSPEDLRIFLKQSNFSSDISPNVETGLAIYTEKKKQDKCFQGSFNSVSRRGISDADSVSNPKSCSLNDSKIQVVAGNHGNHGRNTHSSQNPSTAENSHNSNRTDRKVGFSHDPQFTSHHITAKMSPAKQTPAAPQPMLSPDMEHNYGKNRQVIEDFLTGGGIKSNTSGIGKVPQIGSHYVAKSRKQPTDPQATKVVPRMHKAGPVLERASGTSTARNQSAQSSASNFGRNSGAVAASPSAQRTWASRVAFLSGESS